MKKLMHERNSLQHSDSNNDMKNHKNHLYIHFHPSKEVDLERKVKYLPKLMSDIDEKKIDHNTHELL